MSLQKKKADRYTWFDRSNSHVTYQYRCALETHGVMAVRAGAVTTCTA